MRILCDKFYETRQYTKIKTSARKKEARNIIAGLNNNIRVKKLCQMFFHISVSVEEIHVVVVMVYHHKNYLSISKYNSSFEDETFILGKYNK